MSQVAETVINYTTNSMNTENTMNTVLGQTENVNKYANYHFVMKTVQSPTFRSLIEALKDMIQDGILECSPKGMKLESTDVCATYLVCLNLIGSEFEEYYCDGNHSLGVNMSDLYKTIKSIESDDTLSLMIEKNDSEKLIVRIDNSEKNKMKISRINLLDITKDDATTIPPELFNSTIRMPSKDFQSICRDMSSIEATIVDIQCVDKVFSIEGEGEVGTQKITLGEPRKSLGVQNGLQFVKNEHPDEIKQGYYSLRSLLLFTKCTGLDNYVEILLKNNFPLIIKYDINTLGEIKLCLSPNENKKK
jgi:proliferating cell nuclear antigen